MKEKTVSLLYLLLAEVMPYDDLAQLLRQNVRPVNQKTYYNEHLLAAAEDLYERFIKK